MAFASSDARAQSWSTRIETARQFLLLVYPELAAHPELLVTVTVPPRYFNQSWTEPAGFAMRITERDLPTTIETEIMTAQFLVPGSERLDYFWSSGTFVHTVELERLKQEANEHFEWSDKRMLARLRNAGAMVLPDQIVDPTVFFKQKILLLEPFIGPTACESVQFHLRDPNVYIADWSNPNPIDETRHAAGFEWEVQLRAGPLKERLYVIHYEPFEGKLINIHMPVIEYFGDEKHLPPLGRCD
jgi:hypothetical protein